MGTPNTRPKNSDSSRSRRICRKSAATKRITMVDATKGSERDGVRHEADGDTHGWLKLDSQFQNLLNAGNISDEGGNLVFEIVCKFPVTQPDAETACQGFTNQVNLPSVAYSHHWWSGAGHVSRSMDRH
jgi:hypothetical protein